MSRFDGLSRLVLATLCTLFLTSSTAFGQAATATVRGNVQDTSGGVLPGATVT